MTVLDLFNALLALLLVLGLIGGLYWLVRRFGGSMTMLPARSTGRITIIDQKMLDPRRKLIVVRVGNTEHSLLLGPNRDVHLGSNPVSEKDTP